MKEKIFIVYGNNEVRGYGQKINLYGVFTSKEEAEKTRDRVLKFIVDACTNEWDRPDDAWVEIQEFMTNMDCEMYLGGYCE